MPLHVLDGHGHLVRAVADHPGVRIDEHVQTRRVGRESQTADRGYDGRHCWVLRHAPLRLANIGAAEGANKAAVPWLLRDPLYAVDTVLRLVHVVIPTVWLTTAGTAAVLCHHGVAATREGDECADRAVVLA